jgi:hypothetical protein
LGGFAQKENMASLGKTEIEITEESIAAMNEFSAALNHFSDEMSKAVVVFQEFQAAQHRVHWTLRLRAWMMSLFSWASRQ